MTPSGTNTHLNQESASFTFAFALAAFNYFLRMIVSKIRCRSENRHRPAVLHRQICIISPINGNTVSPKNRTHPILSYCNAAQTIDETHHQSALAVAELKSVHPTMTSIEL